MSEVGTHYCEKCKKTLIPKRAGILLACPQCLGFVFPAVAQDVKSLLERVSGLEKMIRAKDFEIEDLKKHKTVYYEALVDNEIEVPIVPSEAQDHVVTERPTRSIDLGITSL